jgi:hypothetical protein
MNRFRLDDTDNSVVVNQRARPPNPWRWEIYRAGKLSPIVQSPIFFRTMAAAKQSRKNGTQAAIGQAPLPPREPIATYPRLHAALETGRAARAPTR